MYSTELADWIILILGGRDLIFWLDLINFGGLSSFIKIVIVLNDDTKHYRKEGCKSAFWGNFIDSFFLGDGEEVRIFR